MAYIVLMSLHSFLLTKAPRLDDKTKVRVYSDIKVRLIPKTNDRKIMIIIQRALRDHN